MLIMCYKITLTLSQSWKYNALDNQEVYEGFREKKNCKILCLR